MRALVVPVIPAVTAQAPPARLTTDDRIELRECMALAEQLYPGVVGELLADELLAWSEFGYLIGGHERARRLMTHLRDVSRETSGYPPRVRG